MVWLVLIKLIVFIMRLFNDKDFFKMKVILESLDKKNWKLFAKV